jgi:hypothetical protein
MFTNLYHKIPKNVNLLQKHSSGLIFVLLTKWKGKQCISASYVHKYCIKVCILRDLVSSVQQSLFITFLCHCTEWPKECVQLKYHKIKNFQRHTVNIQHYSTWLYLEKIWKTCIKDYCKIYQKGRGGSACSEWHISEGHKKEC